MTSLALPSALPIRPMRRLLAVLGIFALLALAAVAIRAQVAGNRGIAPVATTSDIEVDNISVDVTADTPEDARQKGWKQAIRLAWQKANGPAIPDDQLDAMVSSIAIDKERLGPHRYIATLGVIFDRQRAGPLLGKGGGSGPHSAPMLTLPVMISGGTATMFETRNAWQRAWAEYQFGNSPVDYVRPTGAGGQSLLLTYGQTTRRSRAWWNNILDQMGAADVLVPVAELEYEWPGGPIKGHFVARHGPDSRIIGQFDMQADNADDLPDMLTKAVARFDRIFSQALARGTLKPDPTLTLDNVQLTPLARQLLQQSQAADQAAAAQAAAEANAPLAPPEAGAPNPVAPPQPVAVVSYAVQAATPDPRAFDGALRSLRGIGGVRAVSVSSTAIGGTSVIQVSYAGSLGELASSLRGQGWKVSEGQNALAISR